MSVNWAGLFTGHINRKVVQMQRLLMRYINFPEITFVGNLCQKPRRKPSSSSSSAILLIQWGNENLAGENVRGQRCRGNNVPAILRRTKSLAAMSRLLCSDIYPRSCRIIALAFLRRQRWSSSLPLSHGAGGGGPAFVGRTVGRRRGWRAFHPSFSRHLCVLNRVAVLVHRRRRQRRLHVFGIKKPRRLFKRSPAVYAAATEGKIRDDLICIYGVVFIDCLLSCACDRTLAFVNSFCMAG